MELPNSLGNAIVNRHTLFLVNPALFIDMDLLKSTIFSMIDTSEDSIKSNIVHHILRVSVLTALLAFVLLMFGIGFQELVHLHVAFRSAF